MRVTLAMADAVVVDDVVDGQTFAAIRHELAGAAFTSVHSRGWDKAWRLGDGDALRGPPVYYDPASSIDRPGARYPTSSAIDRFVDAVRHLAKQHVGVVGREGVDWVAMYLSPWLYPVGSALSLHRDGGRYSGAFTYFAHPRWGAHWGGDLLLLEGGSSERARAEQAEIGWLAEDEVPIEPATCVFPRPNRLVLLGPNRPHLVSRVDANAGDHVRTSLAGFFLRR